MLWASSRLESRDGVVHDGLAKAACSSQTASQDSLAPQMFNPTMSICSLR